MNKEQLALRIQELAQKYGVNLDNTPDEFGRLPSDKIAGTITLIVNGIGSGVNYAEIERKMAYISALNNGEDISITFGKLFKTGKDNAVIPSCYIGDDIRRAIIDSLYKSISRELTIYFANKRAIEYLRIGIPFYQDTKLWKELRDSVKNTVSGVSTTEAKLKLKQKQKTATHYIWEFIPKDAEGNPRGCDKTVAASFVVDILMEGGLMKYKELNPSGKWQRIKSYIK